MRVLRSVVFKRSCRTNAYAKKLLKKSELMRCVLGPVLGVSEVRGWLVLTLNMSPSFVGSDSWKAEKTAPESFKDKSSCQCEERSGTKKA